MNDVPAVSRSRRRAITIALLLGTFLASIEASVVGTAMPSIVQRLGCLLVGAGAIAGYTGVVTELHSLAVLGLTLYGTGLGLCISSFTVSVQERVPPSRRGIATALTQFSRSIGGAVGVAVLGSVLLAVVGGSVTLGATALDETSRAALGAGLDRVFAVMAASAAAAAILGVALFPRIGEGMRT